MVPMSHSNTTPVGLIMQHKNNPRAAKVILFSGQLISKSLLFVLFPGVVITMDIKRDFLIHYLAALAYRTQKALREAPESYANFRVKQGVRTPHELLLHMTSVLGYARTFFIGGIWHPEKLPAFNDEIARFHEILESLRDHLQSDSPFDKISPEQLLQGPFSDVMTHAGQLALLRRIHGSPVPPENFIYADIKDDNLGPNQPPPARPDEVWNEPKD